MLTSLFRASLALVASTAVLAQTYTDCNPLEKTCSPDPAFGNVVVSCDFTNGPCDDFYELNGTTIQYGSKGAIFKTDKETDAPTIATSNYIFFGRIDVEVQAVQGDGMVTSIVLESNDLDEIDWEWIGSDNAQAQTRFFGKADPSSYGMEWIIDGTTVRTLTYEDATNGTLFPQTPMQVKLGTWCAGGSSTAEVTWEWAGGYTDFTQAPFYAYYKSVKITDYAGKSQPATESIKEYVYGDKTGSWESIEIVKADAESQGTSAEIENTSTGIPAIIASSVMPISTSSQALMPATFTVRSSQEAIASTISAVATSTGFTQGNSSVQSSGHSITALCNRLVTSSILILMYGVLG